MSGRSNAGEGGYLGGAGWGHMLYPPPPRTRGAPSFLLPPVRGGVRDLGGTSIFPWSSSLLSISKPTAGGSPFPRDVCRAGTLAKQGCEGARLSILKMRGFFFPFFLTGRAFSGLSLSVRWSELCEGAVLGQSGGCGDSGPQHRSLPRDGVPEATSEAG